MMQYRREIDGLRAVAVVPVILFHAGVSVVQGGYVGVDVFFVISGYLITSILLEEIAQDRFSLLGFYERRARRILPALFVMMAACVPFAWMWMLPLQFNDFAQSLVAVSLFASNILFWSETGYFEAASEAKPLLHTWSLAVEEQYYIVFPLLLAGLWRFGRRPVFYVILGLAVLSLLVCVWGARAAPSANFFLPVSRAWELLAGSLCAFVLQGRGPQKQGLFSAIGLGLIVFSVLVFDGATPFPSLYTLAPVGGTMLIILYATPQTLVGQVLGLRPLVGIGLVSYSAYLWHQPVFAFSRIGSVHAPEGWAMAGLVALTGVLAVLSWRYVEQPFRVRRGVARVGRPAVFGLGAIGAALFMGLGLAGHVTDGFPDRTAPSGIAFGKLGLTERLAVNYGLAEACTDGFTQAEICRTAPKPEVLLWGDSYAMHLAGALLASEPGVALEQQTLSVCAPVMGYAATLAPYNPPPHARKCIAFNDRVLADIETRPEIDFVVMSSPFQILDQPLYTARDQIAPHDPVAFAVSAMRATVARLIEAGKRPVLVSPTPRTGGDLGACLAAADILDAAPHVCDFTPAEYSLSARRAERFMQEVADFVPVVMLSDYMCADGICDTKAEDVFLYRDEGHLSVEGTRYLGARIKLMDLVRDAYGADVQARYEPAPTRP